MRSFSRSIARSLDRSSAPRGRRRIACSTLFLLLAAVGCSPLERTEPTIPDTLYIGARLFDGERVHEGPMALGVREGRIVQIGPSDSLEALFGGGTGVEGEAGEEGMRPNPESRVEVVDLQGAFVMPGLIDAHVHPVGGALEMEQIRLSGLKTVEAIEQAIRAYIRTHPDQPVYQGRGWELGVFEGGNPQREMLDRIVSDRPIVLSSWDGHSSWVNSRALELAGVDADTPDPVNGRIERDADGRPTGTLRESAMGLVSGLLPRRDLEETLRLLRLAIDELHSLGITGIIEASTDPLLLEAIGRLAERDELGLRVVASLGLGIENPLPVDTLAARAARFSSHPDVRTDAVKVFADGVPEAHTAALLEPYEDREDDHGILNFSPERLDELLDSLDAAGLQIHIHALGDAAIRYSLDALADSDPELRHHICHLQIVHPDDVPRFAAYGVVANLQGFWAQGDDLNLHVIEPIVGDARSSNMYPFGDFKRSGATLAAGSDWPVSTVNPYHAIQVAATRRQIGVPDDPPYKPDQALEVIDMLKAYTSTNAWLMRMGDVTGALRPGLSADFVVLDRDLLAIPADSIAASRVLATYFKGRRVYAAASGPAGN